MTEKGECPKHKEYEDIIKLTQIDNITYEQVFRCGFVNKIKIMPPIKETIPITDRLEAKVIKVRTIGDTPILVTDSNGTSLTSGSVQLTSIENSVTGGNIYYNPIFNIKIDSNTNTTMNNIQNILSMVDNDNTYAVEEKAQIKDTLTKINDIIISTGSTASKLTPLISLLANIFH